MSDSTILGDFVQCVGVMKPASIKKDDIKQKMRLEQLLNSQDYVLEEKIDGCHYKMIGHRFFSTDNVEKTDNFPHMRDFFIKLGMHNLILDGEIHYPGKTSQYATHVTGPYPVGAKNFQDQYGYIHYTMFDMLRTPKANWTIRNTYLERRKLLMYFYNTFIKNTPMSEFIHLVPMTSNNKQHYLNELLESGLEGGILKKVDSIYHMGKKPMWQWMKIKQEDDADLIIMGFESAKVEYVGSNIENWPYWREIDGISRPITKFAHHNWIGSIVLGAYVNNSLRQICTASGMSEEIRIDMTVNPQKYLNKVARITYMEKTSDGNPRHPAFKNLHETKQPKECTWEFH